MIDPQIAQLIPLFEKRFEFRGILGSGGFALVYLVNNLRLGRLEALKVLSARIQAKPDFIRRFIEEAKYAAALDHPNLVKVYDFGQAGDVLWYSMQYIEGPSLSHMLEIGMRFSEPEVLQLAVPLLQALDYSHRHGLVHRDIKSANILLDLEGRPYITDFGLAKAVQDPTHTAAGGLFGTPAYVSPEQAKGEKLDPRSDLYSFGVTLYRMLSGKFPFESEDPMQTLMLRLSNDPEPLAEKCPKLNPKLEQIIMRSLARDRERRFATAHDMMLELSECLGSMTPAEAPSPAIVQKVSQVTRLLAPLRSQGMPDLSPSEMNQPTRPLEDTVPPLRRRVWWWVAGAALLVAAGAAVWLLWTQPIAIQPPPISSSMPATTPAPPAFGLEPLSQPMAGTDQGLNPPMRMEPSQREPTGGSAGEPESSTRSAAGPSSKTEPSQSIPVRPVRWPQLIQEARPMFPADLAERCAGELINLSVVVGPDGKVQSSQLLSARRPECAPAVQEALGDYLYRPAENSAGQPMETTIAIAVELARSAPENQP